MCTIGIKSFLKSHQRQAAASFFNEFYQETVSEVIASKPHWVESMLPADFETLVKEMGMNTHMFYLRKKEMSVSIQGHCLISFFIASLTKKKKGFELYNW